VKLFSSIDCMFVTLTMQETNHRPFPLTVCLIYEATGIRPASLEAQSKGKHLFNKCLCGNPNKDVEYGQKDQ